MLWSVRLRPSRTQPLGHCAPENERHQLPPCYKNYVQHALISRLLPRNDCNHEAQDINIQCCKLPCGRGSTGLHRMNFSQAGPLLTLHKSNRWTMMVVRFGDLGF